MCSRKKSNSKGRVFNLIIKDKSKNSSEVADRKEHYNFYMVNINFNLLVFQI